jgi:hypothetical protein
MSPTSSHCMCRGLPPLQHTCGVCLRTQTPASGVSDGRSIGDCVCVCCGCYSLWSSCSPTSTDLDRHAWRNSCTDRVSTMQPSTKKRIPNRTSLDLVMVTGSACLLIPLGDCFTHETESPWGNNVLSMHFNLTITFSFYLCVCVCLTCKYKYLIKNSGSIKPTYPRAWIESLNFQLLGVWSSKLTSFHSKFKLLRVHESSIFLWHSWVKAGAKRPVHWLPWSHPCNHQTKN